MRTIVLCGALLSLISTAQDIQKDKMDKDKIDKIVSEAKAMVEMKVMDTTMISGPTLKGAPYSAEVVNEMVQTLGDGNRITSSSSSMVYRDSQGRERREESAKGVVRSIFINDPVEAVSYTLQVRSKEARKTQQRPMVITLDEGHDTAIRTNVLSFRTSGPDTFVFNQEVSTSKVKPVVEHIGTQTVEGVSAEGTRTTLTIPAGQIGNDRPIVTTTERWFSPELQVTVLSIRSDPRTGTSTYKLTNVNRSEPSPALFQVPADYTVKDLTTRTGSGATRPEEQ